MSGNAHDRRKAYRHAIRNGLSMPRWMREMHLRRTAAKIALTEEHLRSAADFSANVIEEAKPGFFGRLRNFVASLLAPILPAPARPMSAS